ncbi:ethylene-insensitive protein 2.1-like isoform X2 [Magnolia sinica]|uniref:ethylene-insensitive protein 2.1-like isoform X2 n=1 Tax=Magnolia sinica TaxID=86752 RepID=UPI00265B0AE7|nr:ethylene-insensitive protein 2.1-like isoform X2 [Magnolia sinica]
MDNKASSVLGALHVVPQLFPSLGPTLLIAVGYIDPGKWAATVDGGARFGFDLVLLVLAFNCSAILCQYLAARVGVVTGKNLAQICREEYDRLTCIILGVQAELSAIVLELTMILGIAHGLNLLFGLDLFTCVFLTAIDAFLFPIFITLLDNCKTGILFLSISGFALLFYVFGILTSQPEIPFFMNGIFPRLRGESAYSLMSLLGASIVPHNFYLHSSIVQQQKPPNVSMGALCHDHFFVILFIFSGVFLVNCVLMLSAATIFHSAGLAVLTFQDSLLLMDQIFQSPIAPFALFLVLFFSSQVTALTWNLGGQVVLHDFFGIDPPVWIHRVTVKALAITPALYCAYNSGAEGIYQLLIFSQIFLAMMLPSSVIPLFRVASSRSIMGAFKISRVMEILALSVFLGMLALNIIFIIEMLFGDSEWIINLTWDVGSSMTFHYILVLLTAFASFVLMLWLAATPLKSASDRPEFQTWNLDIWKALPEPSEYREENEQLLSSAVRHDGNAEHMYEEATLEKSVVSHSDNSVVEFDHGLPETILECNPEPLQSAVGENYTMGSASPTSLTEESTSAVERALDATVDEVSAGGSLDVASTVQIVESKDPVGKTGGVDGDVQAAGKDDDEADVWELEESPAGISGSALTSMSEGPGSFRSFGGKNDDGGNGSGSLSKLSGLGRAARRQLALILDEFWGQLYDFHGLVTQEARAKRMDALLGSESKPTSVKTDTTGMEYAAKYISEADVRSVFPDRLRDCDSPRQQRMPSSLESSYGVQMGSQSWSSYNQLSDAYAQSSTNNLLDASERRYSSLRLPSYSEDRDHQPATIHGYQIASYLNRIAANRNAGSLNIPFDPTTPKSTLLLPNYRDPRLGYNALSSLQTSSLQNPSTSISSRLQAEMPYYDSSLAGASGDVGSSAYPKKYHSLPDISGLVVPNRNSSSIARNAQWTSPIGPGSSVGRVPYERSLYSTTASRAEVPLAFDELSPSKLYKDPFSLPASSTLNTKSLWARQPFEQLFGIAGKPQSGTHDGVMQETISPPDSETKLLQSFRYCIMRLLKLDGSDWLFRQNGGFDEELIDWVAARELYEAEAREANWKFGSSNDEGGLARLLVSSLPHCGESCIWRVSLIVSFGVWCIHRILELSVMESRPELWGKYTYVLNRLQGILEPAFFKPRPLISPCSCLQIPTTHAKRSGPPLPNGLSPVPGRPGRLQPTSASTLLDLMKDVEAAVSGRKGRTGTPAGDVAFPKGKENLASVLKRYKRRLSNKSVGIHEGGPSGSRKVPVPVVSFAL